MALLRGLSLLMSDTSRSLAASTKRDKVGPDYFSFYTREVAELLSQDDSSMLFSSQPSESSEKICREARGMVKPEPGYSCKEADCCPSYLPLFSNGLGASVSDFRQEKLKALLRQSLVVLTQEVDEIFNPVIAMQNLRSQLKRKRLSGVLGAASDGDAGQLSQKKLKVSGSKGMDSKLQDITLSDKALTNDVNKYCDFCQTTETAQWRTGRKGPKSLCNSCGMKYEHGTESLLGSKQGDEKENIKVDNDLQYLLNNDNIYVDEMVNKYSDEYFSILEHMEQQLEELLDTVVTKCRPMTLGEKQQLRKLIQKLPPKNLDRVVEIIQSKKPLETKPHQEIYVDLEKADNVTLWRLYYYVEAVENANKLSV